MKKVIAIMLAAVCLAACGCDIFNPNAPYEISGVQAWRIADYVDNGKDYGSGYISFGEGSFENVEYITGNSKRIQLDELSEDNCGEYLILPRYSYNVFGYGSCRLAYIYGSQSGMDFVYGCIFYSEPVSLSELSQAQTFSDAAALDKALTPGLMPFCCYSAGCLEYSEGPRADQTLHLTDSGLFVLTYDRDVYMLDGTESLAGAEAENARITSVEPVTDRVYNAVYKRLIG